MESHTGPLTEKKTYLDLRTDVSQWTLDNPGYPLGVNFTQEQFLQSHLRNPQLSILQYNDWWESVLSTDSYAESPLIMGLAVFIDYNICVWRRATTTTPNLTLDCVFSAASSVKQIHVVLVAENNSLLDQTAHFSLLTQFGFKSKGSQYCVGTDGTPPHDWRLTPSPFETPTEAEGTERWKYLHAARLTAPHATTSGTPAFSPVATPTIRRPLRDRCVTEHCGLCPSVAALQAKRQLCAQC